MARRVQENQSNNPNKIINSDLHNCLPSSTFNSVQIFVTSGKIQTDTEVAETNKIVSTPLSEKLPKIAYRHHFSVFCPLFLYFPVPSFVTDMFICSRAIKVLFWHHNLHLAVLYKPSNLNCCNSRKMALLANRSYINLSWAPFCFSFPR